MKYAKQFSNMVKALRDNGLNVQSNGSGFMANGYYVETSSMTNIYKDNVLLISFKTPKSAVKWLLNN